MKRSVPWLSTVALLALVSHVQAQGVETAGAPTPMQATAGPRAEPSKLRILAGFHFGGGGTGRSTPDDSSTTVSSAMRPVVGLQAGVDYALARYFALGGELRASFWNTDLYDSFDVGRSTFIDLVFKPRGGYRFRGFPLEVYGTLPLGFTFALANNDLDDLYSNVRDMRGGPGLNFGFGAGAAFFFTSRLGINAEMLGIYHWFRGETVFNDDFSQRSGNRATQLYMCINAVFAL
jgi:hypothetical protein